MTDSNSFINSRFVGNKCDEVLTVETLLFVTKLERKINIVLFFV